MQHYLLLGLELGLYATGEADQVLWYLDCLLTIRWVWAWAGGVLFSVVYIDIYI